ATPEWQSDFLVLCSQSLKNMKSLTPARTSCVHAIKQFEGSVSGETYNCRYGLRSTECQD
ncbi:MAG: hypothetical protein AB8B94_03545, partial [Hyphomicrobiales bacterium]